MGKCYPITRFLDFGVISHLYSQPNRLMGLAINKSVSWVSPVSTVSFHGAYNGRYGSWPTTGSDSSESCRSPRRRSEIHRPLHCRGRGGAFFSRNKAPVSPRWRG